MELDIKELRTAVEAAGLNAVSAQEVLELIGRFEAAEQDALEQARLNGMGASREAALMARVAELERVEAAAQNLVKVKGRHHSEIAYQRLVVALEKGRSKC
jgi:hypothetical protein